MVKPKTLRRKKLKMKRYFHKGGQEMEFKAILDSYLQNLEEKKKVFTEIHTESTIIYDNESSKKNDAIRNSTNTIIATLENIYQTIQTNYTSKQQDIINCINTYGNIYSHKFIYISASLRSCINEINELVDYARNINDMFQMKKVHIHLINQYTSLLQSVNINNLNTQFNNLLNEVDIIIKSIKDDLPMKQKKEQADILALEGATTQFEEGISMVNRPFPDGFIPSASIPYIQGCPLGTVLENGQCVYYNDLSGNRTKLGSIPQQTSLLNTPSSEYIVWFNKINQNSVGKPTIFKRKEKQYLVPLSLEDAQVFNAKYVVSEQNGTPKLDTIFIQDITCCWDQINTLLTDSSHEKVNSYYLDYDGIPQPVEVIEHVVTLRKEESFTKYVRLLDEVDQILSGIQYIETDGSGNILYQSTELDKASKNIIPFYPDFSEYLLHNNTFTKKAYNEVDTFTYILLPNILDNIESLRKNLSLLDTESLNPFKYNIISNFYRNKYLQISISKYYCPFLLPQLLMNAGDYFMIHNTGNIPIVMSISADEKRQLIYPNEICCFVYTDSSIMLKYGCLSFEKNTIYSTKSKKVTKIPTGQYVFVETKPLYDNEKFIMQTIEPLLDSESNLILATNFIEAKSAYYDIDDIYESVPIKVEIITPEKKVVNDKTYDSTISATNISKKFLPYTSDYATLSSMGNIFLFSDSLGLPLIDIFGYFLPVPSPICYDGTHNFWFSLDVKRKIVLLNTYAGSGTFDTTVNVANHLTTPNVSTYMNTSVYTNKDSIPIVGDVDTLVKADISANVVPSLTLEKMNVKSYNVKEKQNEITNFTLANNINIYIQNTDLLITHYKDISGNMNNLEYLKNQLERSNQELLIQNVVLNPSDIYKQVLETASKIDTYRITQQSRKEEETAINNIKTERQTEMLEIKKKIDLLKLSLEKINTDINVLNDVNLNSDYSTLKNTLTTLESSYNALNTDISSINDIDKLKNHKNNTKLLLEHLQTIQQNTSSLENAVGDKKTALNTSLIGTKNSRLQGLISIIESEKDRIARFKTQRNALTPKDDLNNQFNTAVQTIQTIFDTVDNDIKNNVMQTVDIIDAQIKKYETYIKTIQDQEVVIQSIISSMQNAKSNEYQTELLDKKKFLYATIQDFFTTHSAIKDLLNSLSINKESYSSELQNNYVEATTIKGGIDAITDIVALEADTNRINELITLDKNIQTELQTIELTNQAAVKETYAPAPEAIIEKTYPPAAEPIIEETYAPVAEPIIEETYAPVAEPIIEETFAPAVGRNAIAALNTINAKNTNANANAKNTNTNTNTNTNANATLSGGSLRKRIYAKKTRKLVVRK